MCLHQYLYILTNTKCVFTNTCLYQYLYVLANTKCVFTNMCVTLPILSVPLPILSVSWPMLSMSFLYLVCGKSRKCFSRFSGYITLSSSLSVLGDTAIYFTSRSSWLQLPSNHRVRHTQRTWTGGGGTLPLGDHAPVLLYRGLHEGLGLCGEGVVHCGWGMART